MKLFFVYLKLFLVVSLLSVGYFSFQFWAKNSERERMEKVDMSEYESYFQKDTPLVPNKYVQALGYPSLKARSEELRNLYNRRVQAVTIVEERVRLLRRKKLISEEVEKSVSRNLAEVNAINANLLEQINNIIEFAEDQYASDIVRHDSKEDEERAKHIVEENERLLREVEIPQKFK